MDPHDPFDDADVDASLVENAALLDVQLDVAADAARGVPRVGDTGRVTADAPDLLGERDTVAARPVDLGGRQVPDEAAAPREPALLVAPDHDVQRVAVAIVPLADEVADGIDAHGQPGLAH